MFSVGLFLTLMIFLGDVFGDSIIDQMDNFIKAVKRRDFPEIERLAETIDMDGIHSGYSSGFLHIAVHLGDAVIVRLLLSKGWYKAVSKVNQFGYTPLYVVCRKGNQIKKGAYEITEALLKAGANADFGDLGIITGMAPLHTIKDGSMARLLISYGANVDAEDAMKRTPAHLSLLHKDSGVLQALVDGGANFSAADCNGDTIFHFCRPTYGFPITKEISKLLALKGAPLEAFNERGETPLTKFLKVDVIMDHMWRLSWRPHPSRSDCDESKYSSNLSYGNLNDSFYACMLAAGAKINTPNRNGETLIYIAVRYFEVDLVRWLLKNGADVDSKNGKGDTPLLALFKFREPDYVEDDLSQLPLPVMKHVVFIKAVMKVLVNGGADVKATDEAGHDAMYYLEKTNLASVDNEIVHLLLKE